MKELIEETNGEQQYLLGLCKEVQKEFFDRIIKLVQKESKRKEKMKKLIDKIISDFDFEKVHKVMLAVNWRWGSTNGVPPVGSLVLRAQELLQDVSKMDVGYSIGTGGFKATKISDEDDGEGLELEFILTSRELYTKWLE